MSQLTPRNRFPQTSVRRPLCCPPLPMDMSAPHSVTDIPVLRSMLAPALILLSSQALGFVLDSRLDLPYPPSVDGASLDTSLSPKLVKAYYEINFIPVDSGSKSSSTLSHKGLATVDRSSCPYSKEFCRFYFTPSKVSVVQKVEELIAGAKSEVPVVQGLVAGVDQERVFRETNKTVMANLNRTSHNTDVPVYRGTVRVDEVLRRPEVVAMVQTDWNSAYSRPNLQRCLYGPCSPTRWSGRPLVSINSRL